MELNNLELKKQLTKKANGTGAETDSNRSLSSASPEVVTKRDSKSGAFALKKEDMKEMLSPIMSPGIEEPPAAELTAQEQDAGNLVAVSQQELQVTPEMMVIALADYPATEPGQLELVEGQTYIRITVDHGNGWSFGCTLDGTINGVFPQTFVDVAPQ